MLALKAIEDIQSLRELLKTEMSIGEPEEGKVKAEIKVYNDAPLANGGSEIVFMGVGLVVIDGRERGIRKLNEKIKTSRPSVYVVSESRTMRASLQCMTISSSGGQVDIRAKA